MYETMDRSGIRKKYLLMLVTSFIYVYSVTMADQGEEICRICECNVAMDTINCTGRELTQLDNLKIPSHVTKLSLDSNRIGSIPQSLLQTLPNLQLLSLRYNRIYNLTGVQFCTTSNLSSLYLDGNEISELSEDMFEGCETLDTLSLRKNLLTIDIIAAILPAVPNLSMLDCSYNDFGTPTILPENFAYLTHLHALFLERLEIRSIPMDFFQHLNSSHLMQISIAYNSLLREVISSDAFTTLSSLVAMDISHTQLLHNGTLAVFTGIKQSRDLGRIDMRGNFIFDDDAIAFDDDSLFRELENNSIRVLHLEDNYGGFQGVLHKNFLTPLRHLEELYLDHNRLQAIHSRALNRFHNLKLLSLSNNYLNCLTDCRFLSVSPLLPELEILDLSQNALDDTAGYLAFHPDSFPKLRRLNLRDNRITAIRSQLCFSLRTLRHLDLSNNPISVLEPESFVTLGKLSKLTIEDCLHIKELPKMLFSGLYSLSELRLSRNAIATVHHETWYELNHLKILDISHNDLGDKGGMVNISIPSNNLTLLDLSHNNIERLPRDLLSNGSSIHTLSLHHNRFSSLDMDIFRALSDVQRLDVSYNDLTAIDGEALASVQRLKSLNVEGNPFYCGCEARGTITWLQSHRHILQHTRNIKCLGPRAEVGKALLSYAPQHCGGCVGSARESPLLISMVILSSLLSLIVLLLLCVLCVKKYPQQCRQKHKLKKSPSEPIINEVNISVTSVNGGLESGPRETALNESVSGSNNNMNSTASNTNQAIHILSKCIPIIKFSRRHRACSENGTIDAPLMDNIQESEANI